MKKTSKKSKARNSNNANTVLNAVGGAVDYTKMKPLTSEQLECIIQWMNEWEQLKDTAVPIRFEEQFRLKDNERPDEYWLMRAREKMLDIHQWSRLYLSNPDLTDRVKRGLIGDINNRCTD